VKHIIVCLSLHCEPHTQRDQWRANVKHVVCFCFIASLIHNAISGVLTWSTSSAFRFIASLIHSAISGALTWSKSSAFRFIPSLIHSAISGVLLIAK
jgi:hypothetical protein